MTFYTSNVYMLLVQKCTAWHKTTGRVHSCGKAQPWQWIPDTTCTAGQFQSSMSIEEKNNPVGSPLKICLALWSCQSNHVRCDRVSAWEYTNLRVMKYEPFGLWLMQRQEQRKVSARSHGSCSKNHLQEKVLISGNIKSLDWPWPINQSFT